MAPPANPAELRQRITAVVGTDTAPVDRKIEHLSLVIQRHTDDGEKIEYTAVQLKMRNLVAKLRRSMSLDNFGALAPAGGELTERRIINAAAAAWDPWRELICANIWELMPHLDRNLKENARSQKGRSQKRAQLQYALSAAHDEAEGLRILLGPDEELGWGLC